MYKDCIYECVSFASPPRASCDDAAAEREAWPKPRPSDLS